MTAPRSFGWLPETPGQHDEIVGGPNRDASNDLLAGATPIPSEFLRLVPALPAFKDQDLSSTCVPHAVVNVAEASLKAISGKAVDPSSIFELYGTANALIEPPGAPLQDVGTYARVVMHVAKEWGVARDRDWPFRNPKTGRVDLPRATTRVPPDVLQRASSWKLDEQLTIYATGPDRLRTIDAALASLSGVPAAGVVDGAFLGYQGRGVLGAPNLDDARGRHMVAIIGYRTNKTTKKREYLIRNSWRSWGLVFQGQPSMAWVSEEWVHAQEELYRLRVSRGRRTA